MAFLRPKHWIKNTFLFLPIFFSGDILQSHYIVDLCFAFISFSFIASSIYILNDYNDIESDKLHPTKQNRPFASGKISKVQAKLIFVLIFVMSILLSMFVNTLLSLIILTYFILNVFYTLYLKQIAIIDILCIAIGFVLRVFAGAVTVNVFVSEWLVLMTFLLSLLMGFAKRRDDLLIKEESGLNVRKSIGGYNKEFVDLSIIFMAGIIVVCYIMYTTHENVIARVGSQYLYITSLFVIVGILRYLQITFVEEKSGSPTDILWRDNFLQITIFLWLTVFGYFLYS